MSMMSMLIGAGGGADFGDATTTQSTDATYTIGYRQTKVVIVLLLQILLVMVMFRPMFF